MKVIVPTPERNSPAMRALRMECIGAQEILCEEPTHYGELVTDLWNEDEPFILVEWDMVPWPGAIEKLWKCPKPYCTHRYPLHQGNVTLSFGIGKYRPVGPAPDSWRNTEWRLLDGQVIPHVHKTLGRACVHSPPVAHARRELVGPRGA